MALTYDQILKAQQLGYEIPQEMQPQALFTPIAQPIQSVNVPELPQTTDVSAATTTPKIQVRQPEQLPPEQKISAQPIGNQEAPAQMPKTDSYKGMQNTFDEAAKAIQAGANAQAQMLQSQAAINKKVSDDLDNQYKDQLKKTVEFESNMKQHEAKLQKAIDDYSASKIDPNRYWSDMSTGGKVLAAIGLALGLGAGTGRNPAAEVIQSNVNKDIDMQKAELAKKGEAIRESKSLYGQMLDRFGNQKQADAAARLILLQSAEKKLAEQAAKYGAPVIQANAQNTLAQLAQKKLEYIDAFKRESELQSTRKAIQGGQGNIINLIDTLPEEQAKGMRERVVNYPDLGIVGLATGLERAKQLNTQLGETSGALTNIDELQKIGKKYGREAIPTEAKARADTLANMLIGQLRVAITGPGTMSDSDKELLKSIIANPTDVMTFNAQEKLETVKEALKKKATSAALSEGIKSTAPKTLKKVE